MITKLKQILSYFKSYITPNSVLVYFRRENFEGLPPLKNISPLEIKQMDTSDDQHIKEWLNLINQSFLRKLEKQDFIKCIIEHDNYTVLNTYFLMDNEKFVGVVSEGIFKKNMQVGVTHYLGLNKDYLGCGLGKYLILYTLHKMKERNLRSCEGESTLEHKASLYIHFGFNFYPKIKIDDWNTVNHNTLFLMRVIVDYLFIRLYNEWIIRKKL